MFQEIENDRIVTRGPERNNASSFLYLNRIGLTWFLASPFLSCASVSEYTSTCINTDSVIENLIPTSIRLLSFRFVACIIHHMAKALPSRVFLVVFITWTQVGTPDVCFLCLFCFLFNWIRRRTDPSSTYTRTDTSSQRGHQKELVANGIGMNEIDWEKKKAKTSGWLDLDTGGHHRYWWSASHSKAFIIEEILPRTISTI